MLVPGHPRAWRSLHGRNTYLILSDIYWTFSQVISQKDSYEEDWGEDTSEAAVQERMQALTEAAKTLTVTADLEKTPQERIDMFYEYVKVREQSIYWGFLNFFFQSEGFLMWWEYFYAGFPLLLFLDGKEHIWLKLVKIFCFNKKINAV